MPKLFQIACTVPLLMAGAAVCQTTQIPRSAPGAAAPGAPLITYDSAHLKERPYNGSLPKPAFPSTERVQRDFTVSYIYDYAFSNYTPAVSLPNVPRAQIKRDTPEDALIAILSAVRSGDYQAWLQCWDEPGRKFLEQLAHDQKRDAAFWQKAWKDFFGNKDVLLVDRVETVNYVILDSKLAGSTSLPFPSVFKQVKGQWLATNDLGEDEMMKNFSPTLAGVESRVSPEPVAGLDTGFRQEGEAQREFLHSHTIRSSVVKAAR